MSDAPFLYPAGGPANPPPGVANGERREFLRTTLRLAATAGILGATGFAVLRTDRQSCARTFVCGQCPVLGGCDLPQAERFRAEAGPSAQLPPGARETEGD